ncbi:hypothetical protein EDB85DRAFT_2179694 [Lactarius pseudohatsudake]|nr:hypothetical protein EDB85DRAFT_2179694 [Lactarius pseudohatsudake]
MMCRAAPARLRSGLDSLGSIRVEADAHEALAHMRREVLRHLEVASFESMQYSCAPYAHACVGCACPLSTIGTNTHPSRLRPCTWYVPRTSRTNYIRASLTGVWVEVLAALPELEVFRGVSIFRDHKSIMIEENDERARDILSLCLRMRQVEHWDLDPHGPLPWHGIVWRVEEVSGADGGSTWGTHFEEMCYY